MAKTRKKALSSTASEAEEGREEGREGRRAARTQVRWMEEGVVRWLSLVSSLCG